MTDDAVGAADIELALDFGDGGRTSVPGAELEDEVEDGLLPLSEHDTVNSYTDRCSCQ